MRLNNLVESLEQDVMSGEVVKCPILHVRLKFDVFTLLHNFKQEMFLLFYPKQT